MSKELRRMGTKTPYESPCAEVTEIITESFLMHSNFLGGGSGLLALPELGEIDTDASNAVWN